MEIESIIAATIGLFGMSWIIIELLKLNKSVGRLEARLDKLASTNDSHDISIRKLQMEMLEVRTFIKTKFLTSQTVLSEKKSPAQLNEFGRKLFADMGGSDFLSKNGIYLLQKMEEKNPKTAFDVESTAHEVLILATNEEMFNKIKNKVYNYPYMDILKRDGEMVKYEVSLADVCFVLSLSLRDMYLKAHPEVL